jgi:hypothetical protein
MSGDEENSQKADSAEDREVLTAKISAFSADGWRSFCSLHGITVTAMLEVAGRNLAEETMPPTVEARKKMVLDAREVDRLRRSRRK